MVRWGFQMVLLDDISGREHRIAAGGSETTFMAQQVFDRNLLVIRVFDHRGIDRIRQNAARPENSIAQ